MANTLGNLIRRRRIELGLTQEQLAERVGNGVRQAEISRLEHDRVMLPRRTRLEQIAHALDIPIGVLLAESGWVGAEGAFAEPPASVPIGLPEPVSAPVAPAYPGMSDVYLAINSSIPPLHDALARADDLIHDSHSMVRKARVTMRTATHTLGRRRAIETIHRQAIGEPDIG